MIDRYSQHQPNIRQEWVKEILCAMLSNPNEGRGVEQLVADAIRAADVLIDRLNEEEQS